LLVLSNSAPTTVARFVLAVEWTEVRYPERTFRMLPSPSRAEISGTHPASYDRWATDHETGHTAIYCWNLKCLHATDIPSQHVSFRLLIVKSQQTACVRVRVCVTWIVLMYLAIGLLATHLSPSQLARLCFVSVYCVRKWLVTLRITFALFVHPLSWRYVIFIRY
jgi:hypothetical protein